MNSDPTNCDAVCAELAGAASCSVQGQDKDGDGYLSAACVANPGDDCDDTSAAVHPGAIEVCDQIDNDCNGLIDLADGLGIGGTTTDIGLEGALRSLPRIAWAADKSVYGIAYEDTSSSAQADVYFEEVQPDGTIALQPAPLNDASTKTSTATNPGVGLTWGVGAFGVAWTTNTDVVLRTFAVGGSLVTPPKLLSVIAPTAPTPVRAADGTWAVFYEHNQTLSAATLGSEELFTTPTDFSGNLTGFAATASGAGFLIGYTWGNEGGAFSAGALISSGLSALTPAVPVTMGWQPQFAAGPNGFAVLDVPTSTSTEWQVSTFTPAGTLICTTTRSAKKGVVLVGLTTTPTGYLVISSTLELSALAPDCTEVALPDIEKTNVTDVHVTSGAAGYGVVWQDAATLVPKFHLIGPHFCD